MEDSPRSNCGGLRGDLISARSVSQADEELSDEETDIIKSLVKTAKQIKFDNIERMEMREMCNKNKVTI